MPRILLASGNKVATKKKKPTKKPTQTQQKPKASYRTNVEGLRRSPLLIFFLIAIKRYQECYTVAQTTK